MAPALRSRLFIFAPVLLLILSSAQLLKAENCKPAARPHIALVLEGGGALGLAHLGVLKVLEEERIPVSFVTGTSMGAIVGAAYASGQSLEDIQKLLSDTDWDQLFSESPPRRMVEYRQKSGKDGEIFGDARLGIKDGSFVAPVALVEGQYIELFYQRLFGKVPQEISFDELPVAYRAVAADFETGDQVILSSGNLSKAARASMAVPGFFSPVEIDGRLLVDGGITNNFPVDVALKQEADVIIAVQFDNPLRKRDKLTSPLNISAQILDLLLSHTSRAGLRLLRPQDILIQPAVTSFSSTSFKQAREIMQTGEGAAKGILPRLRQLSTSADNFATYQKCRSGSPAYAPRVDYLRAEGVQTREVTDLIERLNPQIGKPLDRNQIDKAIREAFQSGNYQRIGYSLEERDTRQGLVIEALPKEWSKNNLRFGFALEDDFQGSSAYSMGVDARFNRLNSYGGYADAQVEIGRNPRLFTEIYQPIWKDGFVFIAPEAGLSRTPLFVRQDGQEAARYEREKALAGIKAGLAFGRYGEATVGMERGFGRLDRIIGDPALPEFDYDIGNFVSRVVFDQLNHPDFPTKGYRFSLRNIASRGSIGSSDNFQQTSLSASVPLTAGKTTLLLGAEAAVSSDNLPIERSFSLGGVFDISGFAQSSLTSDNYMVGRALMYHRLIQGNSSLYDFGGYLGASLEYASLHTQIESIGDDTGILAGSAFVGIDTPILPVYLVFGFSDMSEHSVYLNFGRLSVRKR